MLILVPEMRKQLNEMKKERLVQQDENRMQLSIKKLLNLERLTQKQKEKKQQPKKLKVLLLTRAILFKCLRLLTHNKNQHSHKKLKQ